MYTKALLTALITLGVLFQTSSQNDLNRQMVINPYSGYLRAESIDINGDGLLDINGNPLDGFEVHLNLGDNTYSSIDYFQLPVSQRNKRSGNFYFFDRDSDGDKDILYFPCPACGNNSMRLLENVGDGNFEDRGVILERFGGFSSPAFTAHDFDGDSDEDFIFVHNKSVKYGINRADSIEFVQIYYGGNFNSGFSNVYDFDVNQDGKNDVIVHGTRGGKDRLLVFHNTGDGFEFVEEVIGGDFYAHHRDVNGDGIQDFYYQKNDCVVVLPSENGSFGAEYTFYCGSRDDVWYFLMDYDYDNDLDIFHGQIRKKGLYLVENENGNFLSPRKVTGTGQQIVWIEETDTNGDGPSDLIIDADDRMLGIVENSNWFTHIVTTDLNEDDFHIVQSDQDAEKEIFVLGDNWMGLVDQSTTIYPGLKTIYNSFRGISDADITDWDNDGDQDIVIYFNRSVSPDVDTSLVWLEKEGQTYLPAQLLISDLTTSGDLAIEDFNNDGYKDILLNGRSLYINDGTASVTHALNISTESSGVHVTDINGDGWEDVLTWFYFNHKPRYYENDQNGGFKSSLKIGGTVGRVNRIDANDIDQDGDQDLLIFYSDSTAVFENKDGDFIQRFSVEGYYGSSRFINSQLDEGIGFLAGAGSTYFANTGNFNFEEGESVEDQLYTQMLAEDIDDNGMIDIVALEYEDDYEGLYIQKDLSKLLDKDGDGYSSAIDCNDSLESINPGAMEIPNNGIDENCDGEDGTTLSGNQLEIDFHVYPNPTNDKVYFSYERGKDISVSLYDITGKLIQRKSNPIFLNLKNLPSKAYFLAVKDISSGQIDVKRIVVQ